MCGKCTKWWTIGDHHFLYENNTLTCPHCGKKGTIKETTEDNKGMRERQFYKENSKHQKQNTNPRDNV